MSKKYLQNMTKSERREYKRYCKNEQQQKLLPQTQKCRNISPELILNKASPGIALGYQKCEPNSFIGIPQGTEGNMIVLGGTGSGKSTGICRPTIAAWKGPLCVTDIKGELSSSYQKLQQQGAVVRPFIKFDPMQENSPSYDPFFLLSKDGEENLVNNIWDIVVSIIPLSCNEKEPFWTQSEQSVFAAALHYYYKQGLDFIETLLIISDNSLIELIQSIAESNNKIAKMYIGELAKIKGETLSAIDRGLRNKLILFATNPFICRALSSKEKNRNCFSWDDLETSNIFLCIPEDKIEQFSSMVNLMYSQLIKHLERRPDKYSREGKMNSPVLVLMDEFARFGKLSPISNAIATLRSKSVNICLVLQSLAQLDKVYGTDERRIILDNCQYYAILRVNDLDTQKYFSELIGTQKSRIKSYGENSDGCGNILGYSEQSSETRTPIIYSHEFSTLNDVLLLSPFGFYRIDKIVMGSEMLQIPSKSTSLSIATQADEGTNERLVIHAQAFVTNNQEHNQTFNGGFINEDFRRTACSSPKQT